MAGIYGVLTKNNNIQEGYRFFRDFDSERMVNDEYLENNSIALGRSVLKKFDKDRFFYEDKEVVCCFEGVNYSNSKSPEHIVKSLQQNKNSFLSSLKGVFSGFLYNKESKKVIVFNDQLSTKNVFYYYNPDIGFFFSNRLYVLTKALRESNVPLEFNRDGIYSLALYGQFFNTSTIIKDIHKLEYGTSLTFDFLNNTIDKESYYKWEKGEKSISLEKAFKDFDELMCESVRNEWQKDKEYGYNHISLLSGGMDSRVNVMLAKKLGFSNITTYSYGNPKSSDLKIAHKISSKEFYSHLEHNLFSGDYLINNIIENYIKLSDGMVLFPPTATMAFSLEKINFSNYGVLHSGQFGSVMRGSLFIKPGFDFDRHADSIGLSGFISQKKMMSKVDSLEKIISEYRGTDYELYTFEQKRINAGLTGDRVASNFVDHVSPFFDIDLNEFLLNLPYKYKHSDMFYISWLKKYHPEILNYKCENIDLKPNHLLKIKYGLIAKKYYNGFKKYFKLRYDSMNPITNWVDNSPNIRQTLDDIFKREIEFINDAEISEDLREIYNGDIFEYRNKFAVITILLSLKLFLRE